MPASADDSFSAGPTYNPELYPAMNNPFSAEAIAAADKRARRRFILALVLGFGVYVLCGVVLGLAGGQWSELDPRYGAWPGKLHREPKQDGNVTDCVNFLKSLPSSGVVLPRSPTGDSGWSMQGVKASKKHRGGPDGGTTVYKSKSYLHVPLSEVDGFFLLGTGRFATGPVKLIIAEPQDTAHSAQPINPDSVEVEVVAIWNDKELLQTVKVCSLTRSGLLPRKEGGIYNERGVGIYTPKPEYPDQYKHLTFEVTVRFPPAALHVLQSLSIRGSGFSPVEVALRDVRFDRVSVHTSLGPLVVPHGHVLTGREINLNTSNGAIEGSYNVSQSLTLDTSNGAIKAAINLEKPDDNARDIDVNIRTSNGYIHASYLSHPDGVKLSSHLESSNGDVTVTHQPEFEGVWQTATSWGKSVVTANDKTKDPTGHKRTRHIEVTRDEHIIGVVNKEGKVFWSPENPDAQGRSTIQTTLGAVTMTFL